MTHDELLKEIEERATYLGNEDGVYNALRTVVELHNGKGINNRCVSCAAGSKCETIQVIERELL